MGDSGIEISPDAPEAVRVALHRLERTEDVRFSPDNRRFALVDFDRNTIAIVDVDITADGDRPRVRLTRVAEFSSPRLEGPHGVDFLDTETIIVANRRANVAVFRLPADDGAITDRAELTTIDPLPDCEFELLVEPGSLAITGNADGPREVLVCDNASPTVTRHSLHEDPVSVTSSEVLLRRRLDVPDGVAVSADDRWIAISDHDAHTVVLYERSSSLNQDSDPDGVLLGAFYPHGLRFSADGRHLFVADSNTPYVHVYAREGQTWRGVHHPVASLRVMTDDAFALGTHPGRCGPKGIDIDREGHVLAVTFEEQPLTFVSIPRNVERSTGRCLDHTILMSYEFEVMKHARATKERIQRLEESNSYRITKPLRTLSVTWSRIRRTPPPFRFRRK